MLSTDNNTMNRYQKNNNRRTIVSLAGAIACCILLCLSPVVVDAQTSQNNKIADSISLSNTHTRNQSNLTYVKTTSGFPIVLPRLSGDSQHDTPKTSTDDAFPSVAPIQHNAPFFSPALAFTPPENVTKENVNQESISSDTISESIQVENINIADAGESSQTQIAAAPPAPAPSTAPVADAPSVAPSVAAPSVTSPNGAVSASAPSPTTPSTEPQSQQSGIEWDEIGYASWYGGKFQGRQTANGEIFDTNKLTAAHKTLPFNSMVQVYNPTTQQSVLVRINDRGPFVESRIIDLSRAAASVIGIASQGISQVYIRVVSEGVSQDLKLIQLGSFGVYENAVDLKTELEQAGIKVEIESGANSIYRVIIPDLTADELLVMRTRLADIGYSDVLVRSVR